MARYFLHGDCQLSTSGDPDDVRVYAKGEEVEYAGRPTAQMEPLDDDAWEAFFAYAEEREKQGFPPVKRFPFKVIQHSQLKSAIEIPENWQEINKFKQISLARELGAPFGVKHEDALVAIQNELDRRASKDLG